MCVPLFYCRCPAHGNGNGVLPELAPQVAYHHIVLAVVHLGSVQGKLTLLPEKDETLEFFIFILFSIHFSCNHIGHDGIFTVAAPTLFSAALHDADRAHVSPDIQAGWWESCFADTRNPAGRFDPNRNHCQKWLLARALG